MSQHIPLTLRGAALVQPMGVRREALHLAEGRIVAQPALGAETLDLRGYLVYPALVNAHDHLHLNAIPPLPDQPPFANSYDWMSAFQPWFQVPAVKAALRVPLATRFWQGGLKNLLCGATTVAHHDPWDATLDQVDFPVRLLKQFGWSHSLGLAPGAWNDDERPTALSPYGPPVPESYHATPHDQPWIIHLAEGTDRVAARELQRLIALGCLGSNSVLVHGVGLSNDDLSHVIERGASVVWCPASNGRILGRTLVPRRLFDAGRLALGSDSRISGAYDLLDELRAAAEAPESDLTPRELLRLATSDSAHVLRMNDVGSLEAGMRAVLLVAPDNGGDPYEQFLALRRSDLAAIFRDGQLAIADATLSEWFAQSEIETVVMRVDAQPKLIDRRFAHHDALTLEGLKA